MRKRYPIRDESPPSIVHQTSFAGNRHVKSEDLALKYHDGRSSMLKATHSEPLMPASTKLLMSSCPDGIQVSSKPVPSHPARFRPKWRASSRPPSTSVSIARMLASSSEDRGPSTGSRCGRFLLRDDVCVCETRPRRAGKAARWKAGSALKNSLFSFSRCQLGSNLSSAANSTARVVISGPPTPGDSQSAKQPHPFGSSVRTRQARLPGLRS